jgi:ATP-dependent Clp protease ATP-binding subunit ClpB
MKLQDKRFQPIATQKGQVQTAPLTQTLAQTDLAPETADKKSLASIPFGAQRGLLAQHVSTKPLQFGNNGFSVDPKILHPSIQKAIQKAYGSAQGGFVTIEHVLKALLDDPEAGRELRKILAKKYKIVPDKLLERINEVVTRADQADRSPNSERKMPLNDAEFAEIFKMVSEVSKRIEGDVKITPEVLLIAITLCSNTRMAKAMQALSPLQSVAPKEGEEEQESALETFCRDITFEYDMGELYPVIGRDKETRIAMNVLAQAKKGNPILVGDPGVGKTAIVEKIAELLAKGDIPESLQRKDQDGNLLYADEKKSRRLGKRLLEIKWELIEAKAGGNPGKFKELVAALLDEAIEKEGEVILFVDEIHKINEQFSSTKSADQLKPPLARGKIRLIGATTNDEYRQKFEKDAALVRRFSKILVEEPTTDEAITMMRGVRGTFEKRHGVIIRDDALEVAVRKSKRYLPDRKLPDSCTEVLDAACALLKNEYDIGRFQKQTIQGEIRALTIDVEEGLKKRLTQFREDTDKVSLTYDKTTRELEEKVYKAIQSALKEGKAVEVLGSPLAEMAIARKIDSNDVSLALNGLIKKQTLTNNEEEAVAGFLTRQHGGELAKVSNLFKELEGKQKHVKDVQTEMDDKKAKIEKLKKAITDETILKTVTIDDILRVLEDKSGIPLAKLQESDVDKFTKMEEAIGKSLIGQKQAVAAIAAAIKNNKAGIGDPNKPIGSFLFLGPTGTGKTELAKVLAKFMFDDEKAIVRFDMSEFGEKHNVARLVGSPPGYVGYEEGGKLTNAMKENPYRIVLFDEIEKAHPDAYNVFLQMLDDGRLTSGKGETVSFKDSVIIMTSNIGSSLLMAPFKGTDGKVDPDSTEFNNRYRDLRRIAVNNLEADPRIKPEFRNRFDDIIAFHPLMRKHIDKIVDIQIKKLNGQLSQTDQKVTVKLDPSAKQYLVDMGSDFELGARPINRFITQKIKKFVSQGILRQEFAAGEEILITKEILEKWQKAEDGGNSKDDNDSFSPTKTKPGSGSGSASV